MGDRNYRNMIDPDEALKWVLDTAIPRPARRVSLAEASGLCLAEESAPTATTRRFRGR